MYWAAEAVELPEAVPDATYEAWLAAPEVETEAAPVAVAPAAVAPASATPLPPVLVHAVPVAALVVEAKVVDELFEPVTVEIFVPDEVFVPEEVDEELEEALQARL